MCQHIPLSKLAESIFINIPSTHIISHINDRNIMYDSYKPQSNVSIIKFYVRICTS